MNSPHTHTLAQMGKGRLSSEFPCMSHHHFCQSPNLAAHPLRDYNPEGCWEDLRTPSSDLVKVGAAPPRLPGVPSCSRGSSAHTAAFITHRPRDPEQKAHSFPCLGTVGIIFNTFLFALRQLQMYQDVLRQKNRFHSLIRRNVLGLTPHSF